MRELLVAEDIALLGVGFVVSFLVALITIAAFIRLLSDWNLVPFAWYRIIAAPIFYFLTRGSNL
jgi:undecaprenyl-diphosphatase